VCERHSHLLSVNAIKAVKGRNSLLGLLGGEGSEELVLLFGGLESAVAELGGGIDELKVDLLGHPVLGAREDGLAEHDATLLGSHNLALDEEVVLVDLTVVGEATHGGDVLLDGIGSAGGVVLDTVDLTGTDLVDLLVDLGTAMVAHLTDTADRPLDGGGMPSTDTADSAETSVSLALQLLDAVSGGDALGAVTLGDSDGVNALVLLEDLTDGDLLLELGVGPLDLLLDGTTVNLDLHNVGLVLSELELAVLGGANDSDGGGVLGDSGDVAVNGLLVLLVDGVLLGVLGEGLLLGVGPVLVEAALDVVVEVLGEHGLQGAEATGGLDVTDHTDDLHGGALNDGGGVDDVLLEDLLTVTALEVLDTVGHASLEAHKGGHVDGLFAVISGEVTNAATVVLGSSLGDESKGAASRCFVFTVVCQLQSRCLLPQESLARQSRMQQVC